MKFAVILALAAVAMAGDEVKKDEVKKDDKKKDEVKKDDKKKDEKKDDKKKAVAKKIALNGACNSKKEKMGCDKDLRCANMKPGDDKAKKAYEKLTKE